MSLFPEKVEYPFNLISVPTTQHAGYIASRCKGYFISLPGLPS